MWINFNIRKRIYFNLIKFNEQIRKISNDTSQSTNQTEMLEFDQIKLKSTFNHQKKTIPNVSYLQKSNRSGSTINLYCCGPTVYDHSHLGHAITYIRCDQIIGILKAFCNINVHFAMNITDIDDKIINKSNEKEVDYRDIANEYHQSFISDMNSLRVTKPDFVGKVTDNIDVIGDYIKQIYSKGYAYVSEKTGDINFDYEKFLMDYSIKNEMNFGSNQLTDKSIGKRSPKDFALWKKSKPNEPKWLLNLNNKLSIVGRPGWHVECSAISDKIFSDKIDIHFGGSDLLFPHHHCESCCSHVYQYQPESLKDLYSSANIWLHSGHLILRSQKMSKSLGNTILIKDFLQKFSANILRLICIKNHYRQEIDFDEKLLAEMTTYDEKLNEFLQKLEWAIYKLSIDRSAKKLDLGFIINEFEQQTKETTSATIKPLNELINDLDDNLWQSILGDFDLNKSLEAILQLAKIFTDCLPYWFEDDYHHHHNHSLLYDCIRLRTLLYRWLNAVSLDYGGLTSTNTAITNDDLHQHIPQMAIVEHLAEFRSNIRQSALDTMAILKKFNHTTTNINNNQEESSSTAATSCNNNNQHQDLIQKEMIKILDYCDQTRSFLERRGIKLKVCII